MTATTPPAAGSRFKPLPVAALVLAVLVALTLVARWAEWYGQRVSLMRYCADRGATLRHLEQVMTDARPAGDASRRPYLVAAKILFLLPRQSDEAVPAYLERVAQRLRVECR